jgi:hypothetical protein
MSRVVDGTPTVFQLVIRVHAPEIEGALPGEVLNKGRVRHIE